MQIGKIHTHTELITKPVTSSSMPMRQNRIDLKHPVESILAEVLISPVAEGGGVVRVRAHLMHFCTESTATDCHVPSVPSPSSASASASASA